MCRSRARRCLVGLLTIAMASPAFACLWDYDTLQQERSRFPSTLELITGKFLRHSPEFYRWRIADREQRLESEPDNLALYDDIAVAWDKLGEHDKAIDLMQKKDALSPGQYETLANLGTFHIHAGRLEEGAEFIRQAIAINPDAHFGREIYQLKLVEYVLSKRADDGTIPQPLGDDRNVYPESTFGFAAYVLGESYASHDIDEQQAAAVHGVLGMMRFGSHDSLILLEVLGDLLATGEMDTDGRQLAARAYLRASQLANDEEAAESYRAMAKSIASNQYLLSEARREPGQTAEEVPAALSVIEEEFAVELADAQRWISYVHEQEQAWVREGSGVNPDEEFAKFFSADPLVNTPNTDKPRISPAQAVEKTGKALLLCVAAIGLVAGFAIWQRLQRRRSLKASLDA